ncbi:MAG: hypothetical protein OEV87_12405, partial [Phycisphaerae bacterium]|nr:hypothetical protein [Phycisphaerae bacterium]
GWAFREQYTESGVSFVFYKPTAAAAASRSTASPTILHDLHAPAVGENIAAAVYEGRKMCCDAEMIEDIAAVVNNPLGLGAPVRFEFTAELVPAWDDTDLTPDTNNLFFTENELLEDTNPDQYTFYKYYHTRGSDFKRDVGRKWALNESGKYTAAYDRGAVFDFSTVIDAVEVQDKEGKRLFGPFNRTLLPCLTFDAEDLNSVGILVEFSFDGGTTWYALGSTVAIDNLPGEAGIRIAEPNLANITIPGEPEISGGDLDGKALNYWTSLADDKLNSRSFKNGDWKTRLRVTASVQLDQRLYYQSTPSAATGSPYDHMSIVDFSEKYTYQKRADSSRFSTSGLPAWNTDEKDKLIKHIDQIRTANEDLSFSGRFTLDRLWLGDGSGELDIQIGDGIRKLTGREYLLHASLAAGSIYPEIVQITYDHQHQKMHLLTRDLRLSEY